MTEIKKNRKHWLRHLWFFVASLVAPFAVALVAFDLHLAWYLLKTGETLVQQAENYGLALEGFMVALIAGAVTWLVTLVIWAISECKR